MSTLKDRLKEVMAEHNLKTQQSLANFAEVSKGLVGQWFNGSTGLGAKPLLVFERKTNYSTEWLRDGTGNKYRTTQPTSNVGTMGEFVIWSKFSDLPKDKYTLIPFYRDTELSAGQGTEQQSDHNHFKLAFSRSTLKRCNIAPENAACMTVTGKSMEPVLPEKTTVGIHLKDTIVSDGQIYAIKQGNLLRVKRLYQMPDNMLRINSYNQNDPAFQDEIVPSDTVEIIGRVFWWSVLA